MSANSAYALLWAMWGITAVLAILYVIKKESGTKASFLALTIGSLFITNMVGREWKKSELEVDMIVADLNHWSCSDYTDKAYNDYMRNYHSKLYMPYFMGPKPLPWGERITKC